MASRDASASSTIPVTFTKLVELTTPIQSTQTAAATTTIPTRRPLNPKMALTPSDLLFPMRRKFSISAATTSTQPSTPVPLYALMASTAALALSSKRNSLPKISSTHRLDPLSRTYDPSNDARPIEELLARPSLPRSQYHASAMLRSAEIVKRKSGPELRAEEKERAEKEREMQREQMEVGKQKLREMKLEVMELDIGKKRLSIS